MPAGTGPRELILKTSRGQDAERVPVVEVRVIDTGPGMAPEVVAKLFTPYFTTKAGGSGLGLPTTRRLIEAQTVGSTCTPSRAGAPCSRSRSRRSRRLATAGRAGPYHVHVVLTVIQGPDKGRRFELPDHEPQLLGRSSEALPLDDNAVSRRHAELTPDDGQWYIRDLESQNGTYVNGVRISDRARSPWVTRFAWGRPCSSLA